jgi:hypothetical protein
MMTATERLDIRGMVSSFLTAERQLLSVRQRFFPRGRPVMVRSERYTGPGVVDNDGLCHLTCVPVRIPNGNVWYYPVDCVEPVDDVEKGAV